jgi:hypothetical protein
MACCSSVQWNSSISETARNRHMYIYGFFLEWPIQWPPRILTFPPGTLYRGHVSIFRTESSPVNCCWSSPAQPSLVPIPTGLNHILLSHYSGSPAISNSEHCLSICLHIFPMETESKNNICYLPWFQNVAPIDGTVSVGILVFISAE